MAYHLHAALVAYNGVAVAGDDARYQFEQVNFTKSHNQLTLATQILVTDTGSGVAVNIAALENLRGSNGDLVYQLGRELELDDLVGDGTTTATSATGGFTAAHVGLWLSIRGHAPRRITAVGSSTSVTLHATLASATYRCLLPSKMFAGTHAALTFHSSRGEWRAVANSPLNTEYSRLVEFTVRGEIPPDLALQDFSFRVVYSPSRRRTATLTGTYVAADTDGDDTVESAKAIYDANIVTVATNHLSGYGGITAYELIREEVGYKAAEDEAAFESETAAQKNYSFTRVYQERLVADHANIIDQKLTVTRDYTSAHGLGFTGEVNAQVTYACAIDKTALANTGIRAFYLTTVRALIVAAIKRQTGTSSPVLRREAYSVDESNSVLSAQWTVFLKDKSSKTLRYDKTITTLKNAGKSPTKLRDGVPHTYVEFEEGAEWTRTVQTTVISQTPISVEKVEEVAAGASGGGSSSGVGGVSISGGGGDEGTLYTKDVAGTTIKEKSAGTAPAAGSGVWKPVGPQQYQEGDETWGMSPDGGVIAGMSKAAIYTYVITRSYYWAVPAAPVTPVFTTVAPLTTGSA